MNKPTVWEFLKAFQQRWVISFTGGACAVLLTFAGIYSAQSFVQRWFFVPVVIAAMIAAYGAWSAERKTAVTLEARISELTELPHCSTSVVVKGVENRLATWLAVRIVPLGSVKFAVSGIEILVSDKKPIISQYNSPVPEAGIEIPIEDFWTTQKFNWGLTIDFQVRVRIKWLDQERWLEPEGFALLTDVSPVRPLKVSSGYNSIRVIACPKCGRVMAGFMSLQGIMNEKEFQERKVIVDQEVKASCPQHYSQFMLSSGTSEEDSMGTPY
jgi:hypothetical protein